MLAALLGVVRADFDRQVGWARGEARRQIRHIAVIGAITTMAVLAALGALIVGLIALYSWLTPQVGSLASLGMIGAGLVSLMLLLLLVAFLLRRRPGLRDRPTLQVSQPAALLRTGLESNQAIAGGEESSRLAASTLSGDTRSQLGTLALIAIAGMIMGRWLGARPLKK